MMRRVAGWLAVLLVATSALTVASTAEMYFSSDKNGQQRVTNVQEGDSVFIVIRDADENIDCDVRDKIWTDVKIMDPKTGAYIAWVSYLDAGGDADGDAFNELGYAPYRGHFPGNTAGWLGADYLEETGADTGLFVSKRSFQIGTREEYDEARRNTHVVANSLTTIETPTPWLNDFVFGNCLYVDGLRRAVNDDLELAPINDDLDWNKVANEILPDAAIRNALLDPQWLAGRFENMDTLIGMCIDPNDDTDVATAMMKIIDTEGTIAWDQLIYKDPNTSATITVVDADENLNCNEIEFVPVFILVNPGSWNPVDGEPWIGDGGDSPVNFCMLKRTGGVNGAAGPVDGIAPVGDRPMRWYNMYHSEVNAFETRGAEDGRYYVQYPTRDTSPWNVVWFDTVEPDGITAVSFYAQETGVDTGVFQLNLNSILDDLGFNALEVRDVLSAYYLDPNDEDDFKIAVAYIEERQHSVTSFTNALRQDQSVYWLGRDPIYIQVIDANANVDPCCPEQVLVLVCDVHEEDDAEWLLVDETSSNSPVFFTNGGVELLAVWSALGVGIDAADTGGYQLVLDNWQFEAFNEDDVFVQYNDAYYGAPNQIRGCLDNDIRQGLAGVGDSDTNTSFPPLITTGSVNAAAGNAARGIGGSPGIRVPNDVSFDVMSIGDTQIYDGSTVKMWFLDRNGNRVSGYVASDCVFIEIVDPDQDEDQLRRERVDAFWDAGQGGPIGPEALNDWDCGVERELVNPWNQLLGDTNIFNNSPDNGDGFFYNPATRAWGDTHAAGWGKLYVANPRNGRWAPVDMMETGVATGDFVSVICVDLVDVHECVPTLGVLPGDTIVAFYQDPSNHSDSAMISLKVGIGGGTTPPSQSSTTTFADAAGGAVANYTDADLVYVKVVDPSHAGAATLSDAVTIGGVAYDLAPLAGAPTDTLITAGLDLDLEAGDTVTATYVDPTDPTDTSSATVTILASELVVTAFYAGPSPATGPVTFGYEGSGTATVFSVEVYDLAGHLVWTNELANVSEIVWECGSLANGAYVYICTATDGTETFHGKGKVFLSR
ncbi:MAG: T9SS type A sorting domain-containing protein [Candidatus Bipolaricaulota bacterium]